MKTLIASVAVAIATPALAQSPPLPQPARPVVREQAAAVLLAGPMLRYENCAVKFDQPLLRDYRITPENCLRVAMMTTPGPRTGR